MADPFDETALALTKIADRLDDGLGERAMQAVGQAATFMIVNRTKQGLDADGEPFVPYSYRYAQTRARKSLETDVVDLARTGHMLGAVIPRVTGRDEVRLVFAGTFDAQKGRWQHEGTPTIPRRQWFDERRPAALKALEKIAMDEFGADLSVGITVGK